ncbi:DUF2784 domain-containing protein [Lentisalinibacter sediminis]|uniref:DUF2784 domain-containing protein n=1 Tax=Lentisalinibacter sediminis TaxID=2992237 RepID=UPI00386AD650
MAASLAADAVLLLHAAFIVFVVAGGLLALRWPLAAAVHLPCAAWGAGIEFTGGVCPLTPLEQRLRASAGEAGYSGGFIEHYLLPLIYPAGLTPAVQLLLGSGVILVNLVVYGIVLRRRRAGRRGR